jgi:hypothetical protein
VLLDPRFVIPSTLVEEKMLSFVEVFVEVEPRMVRTLRSTRAGDAGDACAVSELEESGSSMLRSNGPSVGERVPCLYPEPLLFCR